MVPYITAADAEDRLDWLVLVEALAEGHRGPEAAIRDTFLGRGGDTLLSRAAWIDGMGVAVKSVTVMPGNAARGAPSVHGALVLFEDDTGRVEAVIDSALVTKWKTAGDSILGARLLARPDSRRLLILGAGPVAESLIDAYGAAFPGIEAAVWNRTPERARALAARRGVAVAEDLAGAVAEADIVAAATMAAAPVLRGDWLRPGQHLDLIGAFKADMREADDACLRRARIFVDSFDTTLEHIGELRDPLARGVISRAEVLGDLRDLVAGRVGRATAEDITLFKNGGGAHLDLMTARVILSAWRAGRGGGRDLTEALRLLRPGETCWRIETAERVAVIVDAAEYFAVVRAAMLKARESILLIGWDFDTRIVLDPADAASGAPRRLGRFLNWLIDHRPELRIHVLKWDLGTIHAIGRGSTPLFVLDWMTKERIRFRLDGAHPMSSAHHQKIAVIDDALAFCGGIDMTADRWDTPEHLDDDPRRRRPTTGRRYGPWHDAATAVDGAAARALGDLARDRWRRATGEDPARPAPGADPWPDRLEPQFRNVEAALSRTMPPHDDEPGVHEIEALYLAAIAAARRTLYIESQYFAARRLAEAMAARLAEPDGPEIVVINPEVADGWLEEAVMGASRARLLRLVRRADVHGRFRIYTPVTRGGKPIYVHAKIMVVDDRLLRVGSSNLNNRSMGFDTECDLSLEAVEGEPGAGDLRAAIAGLRDGFVAEHLGVAGREVAAAVDAAGGGLIEAIEALRSGGRSLRPFEPPEISDLADEMLGESEILDPERPARQRRRILRGLRALSPIRLWR